jgi:oxygen-independent coproporphyrinogen-3 oxidase
VRKCPYCDFNSHQQKGELPVAEYVAALSRRPRAGPAAGLGPHGAQRVLRRRHAQPVRPAAIGAILDACSARLRFAPEAEITMECNPGTAEHGRFEGYLAAGVNRVSFGVQSFDDGCLQRLGRIHDSSEANARCDWRRTPACATSTST